MRASAPGGSLAATLQARRLLKDAPWAGERKRRPAARVARGRATRRTPAATRAMQSRESAAPAPPCASQPALSRCRRTRSLRPAPRTCGSPSLSGKSLWRVPWFHENALLQVGRSRRRPGRPLVALVALLANCGTQPVREARPALVLAQVCALLHPCCVPSAVGAGFVAACGWEKPSHAGARDDCLSANAAVRSEAPAALLSAFCRRVQTLGLRGKDYGRLLRSEHRFHGCRRRHRTGGSFGTPRNKFGSWYGAGRGRDDDSATG